MRQGQGGVAASIVVNNANLLEVAGPVIGKVSLYFLQGDDLRYYRFDLRLRSRGRQDLTFDERGRLGVVTTDGVV